MRTYTLFYNGPFSQWHACNFTLDKTQYNCAEQYMMHQKALLFKDEESAQRILGSFSPMEEKRIGREVKGFKHEIWVPAREKVVYQGNHAKFTQNPALLRILMETKGTTLVEASPYDTIWGIGLAEDELDAWNEKHWRGQNLLGKILTQLREDLERHDLIIKTL